MQRALTFDSTCDFSRFDTRMKSEAKAEKKEKTKSAVKTKEAAPAKRKPIISGFGLVSWAVCMALLFSVVYSYMTLTEAADRATTLQSELDAMREQTQLLEIKREQKYGSKQIQEIAVNELGMQKLQKAQIVYVDTNAGDHTEIANSKKDETKEFALFAGISSGFNTFIEYLN